VSLVLDTHTFLWFADDDDRLSHSARRAVERETGTLSLSVGSVWEMAIKSSIGRLLLATPVQHYVRRGLDAFGVDLQPITLAQLERVSTLPFPPSGHRDPFDRLLAALAIELACPIVSRDPCFDMYGVPRIW
jgi:PIN domain nuclease of toxin-antitoxin system